MRNYDFFYPLFMSCYRHVFLDSHAVCCVLARLDARLLLTAQSPDPAVSPSDPGPAALRAEPSAEH